MAVKAVREISPLSLGSGVRLRELIELPEWLIFVGKILGAIIGVSIWLAVHYVITGTVAMFILGWIQFGPWWAGLFTAWIVPAAYWACRVTILLRAGEAATTADVLQGMWRGRKVRKMWQPVMYQLKLTSRADPKAVPPLVHLLPTASGVKGTVVTGAISYNSHKLVKLESELASGLFCDRVIIRPQTPSIASIRFDWGRHLAQKYQLHELPPAPVRDSHDPDAPARIRFGVNADGTPATLVSNLSTLIGGATGGGKSRTLWSILAGYMEQVPIRLRVVDPAEAEYAELGEQLGKGLVHDFAGNQSLPGARKLEDFWADLEEAFNRRLISMKKSGRRFHRPTEAEPLDITIIDELIPIAPQLRKEATDHIIGRIAYLGRKAGFIVIALTQAAQVDVVGRVRDLFPQRLTHQTLNRYLTDAVLGDGAESDGARASHLDTTHDRGVGYMAAEGVRGYMGYRSAWVSKDDISLIARGQRPVPGTASQTRNEPHVLYRFWGFDSALLYVGITNANRYKERWAEHKRDKWWWDQVDESRNEVYHTWPDWDTAHTAEVVMIKRLKPVYNDQHNEKRSVIPAQRRSPE